MGWNTVSKYPKNAEEIRVFYCLTLKNGEEIRRRWGKKQGIVAKIFTPDKTAVRVIHVKVWSKVWSHSTVREQTWHRRQNDTYNCCCLHFKGGDFSFPLYWLCRSFGVDEDSLYEKIIIEISIWNMTGIFLNNFQRVLSNALEKGPKVSWTSKFPGLPSNTTHRGFATLRFLCFARLS